MGLYDRVIKVIRSIYMKSRSSRSLFNWQNTILILGTILFLFLLSGGMATSLRGTTVHATGGQTLVEFFLFLTINLIYLSASYLMYRGIVKAKVDQTLIIIGVIMLVISFLSEIYIISSFIR